MRKRRPLRCRFKYKKKFLLCVSFIYGTTIIDVSCIHFGAEEGGFVLKYISLDLYNYEDEAVKSGPPTKYDHDYTTCVCACVGRGFS